MSAKRIWINDYGVVSETPVFGWDEYVFVNKSENVDEIFAEICEINVIRPKDVARFGKSRLFGLVELRYWHMFLCRVLENMTFEKCGMLYEKDAATAMWAVKKIKERRNFDKTFARKYAEVIDKIEAMIPGAFDE
jgi:chromosomal replication initiation ATPase DnaA